MRRIHIPANVTYRYRVLNPTGKHMSFRIQKFEGETFISSVKENASLDAINAQFRAGTLTKSGAREQVDLLVESLYRADGVKISRVTNEAPNMALLEKFLKEKYTQDRLDEIKNPKASMGYFERAVRCLGELSLLSATKEEMKAAINARYKGMDQHRIADSLNTILKWLGRTDVSVPWRKDVERVIRHIKLNQADTLFNRIVITEGQAYGHPIPQVTRAFKVMCQMALYTGMRKGELMAVEASDLAPSGKSINVNWQIDPKGVRCWPKWGKRRKTAPFPEGVALFNQWLELRKFIEPQLVNRAAEVLGRACELAFPGQAHMQLVFHDLRHSYAIALLEHGLSYARVAMNLGDTEKVVREHYTGYGHTEVTVEQDFEILNMRTKLKLVENEGAE